ncbi:G-protein coupled receptor 143-like isoform X2 [Ambystoma mexicanum]|uniref:G-protein coupled receptor 143-like isoform X2 n=1 Tax=Ambystoma mexicanum TaxID=8296 RepID=UPI0037E732A0
MALLRTQRFCCPQRDPATELVLNFHPEVFHGLCLCSATLGLAGMLFQALPRHRRGYAELGCASPEKRKPALRIGRMATLCCCLGNAGIVLRSVLWYTLWESPLDWLSRPLCIVLSTWIHYFYTALFCALFFYAVEMFLLLKRSGGVRCDSLHGLVLFHEVVTYVPLLLALLGNPMLLARAFCAVTALLRKKMGSYTASERLRKRKVRARFLQITVTFTACWLVNVAAELLLLFLEVEPPWSEELLRVMQMAALTSWIMAAILNPFYGLLHSLAIYGWRGCALQCTLGRRLVMWTPLHGTPHQEEDSDDWDCEEEFGFEDLHGNVVVPPLQELVDSGTYLDFGGSAKEVNAIRLLGAPQKALHAAI